MTGLIKINEMATRSESDNVIETSKLIIIDGKKIEPTVTIVNGSIDVMNQRNLPRIQRIDRVEIHSASEILRSHNPDNVTILSVISVSDSGITDVKSLLEASYQVYLVSSTPFLVSGIDCMTAFLAGVAGVIDERYLTYSETISDLISFSVENRRFRRMRLLGETTNNLVNLREMLVNWDDDLDADPGDDQLCWRTAIALAQLPTLEPMIGGSSQPMSYVQLAKSLNLHSTETSFRYNVDDLRKVLSTLGRRWFGDHDAAERRFFS